MKSNTAPLPLISVIIPCFNHGRFLACAIESAQRQTYKNVEIIVVDDGSVDNTREVASCFPGVIYVHQANQGLSAARNKGYMSSSGDFLIFLDADDWLLPEALASHVRHLPEDKSFGLIAGNFIDHYEESGKMIEKKQKGSDWTYQSLLLKNQIAMHGAVMYPRWIFDRFQFDTTLNSCEDWDMYLKIAREFPIVRHDEPVAVYRRYGNSMSANSRRMLECGMDVMNRQSAFVKTDTERKNLLFGKKRIRQIYTTRLYKNYFSMSSNNLAINEVAKVMWMHNKWLLLRFAFRVVLRKTHLSKL